MRAHRKQWALSQTELGLLLGCSTGNVSRMENGKTVPKYRVVLAAELIFGENAKQLFPKEYKHMLANVADRVRALERTARRADPATAKKQRALAHILYSRLRAKGITNAA